MRKTIEIIRYELVSAFRRLSYLFLAFGIPLLAIIAFAGFSFIKSSRSSGENSESNQEENELVTEGYIDNSGLIDFIPQDLPENILVSFSSESEAQSALDSGIIEAFYIIPADYIESG